MSNGRNLRSQPTRVIVAAGLLISVIAVWAWQITPTRAWQILPTPQPLPTLCPRKCTVTPGTPATPGDTQTPEATRTPRPTRTPVPTSTPVPTATPLPQNLVVTSTADASTCPAGPGNPDFSLRCAILAANRGGGFTISFDIPSSDRGCGPSTIQGQSIIVCTITVTHALPSLTVSNTVIDGYSQKGAHPNGNDRAHGDNAVLTVQLEGAGAQGNGISVKSGSGVAIRGLSITGFTSSAISLAGIANSVVSGNFLGLAPDGSQHGNQVGATIESADHVTVGGPTPDLANIIAGNRLLGIRATAATALVVAGNDIGTDPSGARASPNGGGIDLVESGNATVGGSSPSDENVISSNSGTGIQLEGGHDATIAGNMVGLDGAGSGALPNRGGGISLTNVSHATLGTGRSNVISGNDGDGVSIQGGSDIAVKNDSIGTDLARIADRGNKGNGVSVAGDALGVTITSSTIAHNGRIGISVSGPGPGIGSSVSLRRNSIFGNKRLGIDVSPLGTANCSFRHPFLNGAVPCPVIATTSAGRVSGTACSRCRIEVYLAAHTRNDLGFGEGKVYLGGTKAGANGTWAVALSAGAFAPGRQMVTATATMPASGSAAARTSEFAFNMPAATNLQFVTARYSTYLIRQTKRHPARTVRTGIIMEWRAASLDTIALFRPFAGIHPLTPRPISPYSTSTYQIASSWKGPGPFRLVVTLLNGVQLSIPARLRP